MRHMYAETQANHDQLGNCKTLIAKDKIKQTFGASETLKYYRRLVTASLQTNIKSPLNEKENP